jgi:hypothetical protein
MAEPEGVVGFRTIPFESSPREDAGGRLEHWTVVVEGPLLAFPMAAPQPGPADGVRRSYYV